VRVRYPSERAARRLAVGPALDRATPDAPTDDGLADADPADD